MFAFEVSGNCECRSSESSQSDIKGPIKVRGTIKNMTTLLITLSDDDNLNSVDYALKKNQFEREFFELKQPAGIVQLLGDNRIRYMETNEFRDSIAKVKSGRKEAAGSGNLKDFFEVWLKDPNRRTYPGIDFRKESAEPRKAR